MLTSLSIIPQIFANLLQSQLITFNQLALGGANVLKFSGPTQGVYPVPPDDTGGFSTFNLSTPLQNLFRETPYVYTFTLQGISTKVSCSYEPTSPLAFSALPGSGANATLTSNANCAGLGQAEVLTNVSSYVLANSNNILAYWACQSPPNGTQLPSYSIYLRGLNSYGNVIGNMTCIVSPIQTALLPVTFQSTSGVFSIPPRADAISTGCTHSDGSDRIFHPHQRCICSDGEHHI